MDDYLNLLNKCPDIGESVNDFHFREASNVALTMNISLNKFAQNFQSLPKVKADELSNSGTEVEGVLAKSQGILFVNLNETAKKSFNSYLKGKFF